MAGLLNLSPEVIELLRSTQGGGLLAGPAPSTGLFGNGFNDPRSAANMGLAMGLLTGDLGKGLAASQAGFADASDRQVRQQAANLALGKEALGLQNLVDNTKRQRSIRDELLGMERGGQGGAGPYSISQSPYTTEQQSPGGHGGGPRGPGATLGGGSAYMGQSGPQPQPFQGQGQDLGQDVSARLLQQAQVYSRYGDFDTANKLYEHAAKLMPEVNKIEVALDPQTRQPVNVITYKSGRQEVSRFGATPKVHWADTGSTIQPINEYTLDNLGPGIKKTPTPGEVLSNNIAQANLRVAQGNLGVSRERLALEANSPQYIQTENGLVALPKRPQAGAPLVGQPVTGPDGQPLGPQLKPIPASANTAILTNTQNLSRAQEALTLLQGGKVGAAQGDKNATGVKAYFPNGLVNRLDSAGVDTRAAIADLGSMVIHDRSGAAVTAAESPRLMPFIPLATDDAATAEKKLKRFISVYQQENDALAQTYSREQGYRESSVLKQNTARKDTLPGALPLPAKPSALTLKRGQSYSLPNGVTAEWDGMQFTTKGGK